MLYFDNNATTPLAEEVKDSIIESLNQFWANPSSNYREGKAANNVIQNSRQLVANMINANNSQEIIFTSGGTEVFFFLIFILT
jgi:cysteine desulfurase